MTLTLAPYGVELCFSHFSKDLIRPVSEGQSEREFSSSSSSNPHNLKKCIVVLFYASQLVWFEREGEDAVDFLQAKGEAKKACHTETLSVALLHQEMTGADEQGPIVLHIA